MQSLGQVRVPWGDRKELLREGTWGREDEGKKGGRKGTEEGRGGHKSLNQANQLSDFLFLMAPQPSSLQFLSHYHTLL